MKKSIGKEQMFRIPYTFFHIRVIIFSDFKYAKSIRKRKSHDMKEQGHSQCASLLAHESSPKGGAAFKLHSEYQPTGDQPQAIAKLVEGFQEGNQAQTLLGVTGSGKTFTMANVIQALNKPTLIIAHNKTLAAQLYGEFKEFFPENAVEYFVS